LTNNELVEELRGSFRSQLQGGQDYVRISRWIRVARGLLTLDEDSSGDQTGEDDEQVRLDGTSWRFPKVRLTVVESIGQARLISSAVMSTQTSKDSIHCLCDILASLLLEESHDVTIEVIVFTSAVVILQCLEVIGQIVNTLIIDGDNSGTKSATIQISTVRHAFHHY
jgi:hypothetical protein